jgi:hypothetical protein
MWTELVKLVETRCREEEGCNTAQANALIALYGALVGCQIAFARLEAEETDAAEADAALAIGAVLETLHNVQSVLRLLQPGRERILADYVRSPRRAAVAGGGRTVLRQHVEVLRNLLALEITGQLDTPTLSGFMGARRRMAEVIRQKCTPEQLLG